MICVCSELRQRWPAVGHIWRGGVLPFLVSANVLRLSGNCCRWPRRVSFRVFLESDLEKKIFKSPQKSWAREEYIVVSDVVCGVVLVAIRHRLITRVSEIFISKNRVYAAKMLVSDLEGKKNQISSKVMSERRVYSCERCGVRDRAGSYQAPVNYAS